MHMIHLWNMIRQKEVIAMMRGICTIQTTPHSVIWAWPTSALSPAAPLPSESFSFLPLSYTGAGIIIPTVKCRVTDLLQTEGVEHFLQSLRKLFVIDVRVLHLNLTGHVFLPKIGTLRAHQPVINKPEIKIDYNRYKRWDFLTENLFIVVWSVRREGRRLNSFVFWKFSTELISSTWAFSCSLFPDLSKWWMSDTAIPTSKFMMTRQKMGMNATRVRWAVPGKLL